jgi:hypothetical protein
MLLEEAHKPYNKLAKESIDEIIGGCLFSTPSPLPVLSQSDENGQQSSKTNNNS